MIMKEEIKQKTSSPPHLIRKVASLGGDCYLYHYGLFTSGLNSMVPYSNMVKQSELQWSLMVFQCDWHSCKPKL